MNELKPRIEQIVLEHLDIMEQTDYPIDLVENFALPIPSLAICELLGVPYDHRREFQCHCIALFSLEVTAGQAAAAMVSLNDLLLDLIRQKRKHPANDLLSELIGLSEFNDEELAGIGVLLLTAGHETTASMLGLGVFTLLSNPLQLAQLRDDPTLTNNAIEELLRYLTIFQFGVSRTPLEDVLLEDYLIKAGESMTISLPAVNSDPMQFSSVNQLDIKSSSRGHLAFGFGIHYCLGRNLALIEM